MASCLLPQLTLNIYLYLHLPSSVSVSVSQRVDASTPSPKESTASDPNAAESKKKRVKQPRRLASPFYFSLPFLFQPVGSPGSKKLLFAVENKVDRPGQKSKKVSKKLRGEHEMRTDRTSSFLGTAQSIDTASRHYKISVTPTRPHTAILLPMRIK